jgi:hypothetical protein
MDFGVAIKILNKALNKNQPKTFSSTWIYKEIPSVYRYVWKNIRTENDDIDWDKITVGLSRKFQKRWVRYKRKTLKEYENQNEVDLIISKYQDKLYTFLTLQDDRDKILRDRIIVSLTRISQKGNILARQELVKWLRYIADEWIDIYPCMDRWKTYPGAIDERISRCIILYRYTGSFLGYMYKTLEYSAKALPPVCSFDDTLFDGSKTRGEYIIPVYD